MRLLYCHNEYAIRSGEDAAFDHAVQLLRAAGHEVTPLTRSNRGLAEAGLLAQARAAAGALYSPTARREVADAVARTRPDVAIVQNVFPLLSPSILLGLRAAGVPVVQLIFNYRLLCANGQLFTGGRICEDCAGGNHLHGVLRRCVGGSLAQSAVYSAAIALHRGLHTWRRAVTRFVVPDQFLGDKLAAHGIPRARIEAVCNPFPVRDYEPAVCGEGYGLFVGRLIRAKGVLTLLDAAALAPTPRIIVAGDGEDRAEVERHPEVRGGRVEFVGPCYGDRFTALMRGAEFVVVPSEWYDNLPMIVCQAFAMGKPVVASRINGIPEYVTDGHDGLLFPPGDAAALMAAMQRLAGDRDLARRLGTNARRTAEERFDDRVWQARMGVLLERVAAAPGTGGRQ
jgi:glycosyltransferase involved in cell wall biosynthesis